MPAEDLSYRDGAGTAGPRIENNTNMKLAQNESEDTAAAASLFTNIIKVIAIGGGGGNALNHIISHGIEGVDMLAVNTDIRSLDMSMCDNKIVLGESVTKGLGAGAKRRPRSRSTTSAHTSRDPTWSTLRRAWEAAREREPSR